MPFRTQRKEMMEMRTESKGGECELVIGSVTHAQRAQAVLSRAAILSRMVKANAESGRGCAYGVALPCEREEEARTALRRAGIRIKR